MVARLATSADLAAIAANWQTWRNTEAGVYAREHNWTVARLQELLDEPLTIIVIDPATDSAGLFSGEPPNKLRVRWLGTLLPTGTPTQNRAAMRAADGVFIFALNLAISRGATMTYGRYQFDLGVNEDNTRALRYFSGPFYNLVKEEIGGMYPGTLVTITVSDAVGLRDFLVARQ